MRSKDRVVEGPIEGFPAADVVNILHGHDTEIVLAVTSTDRKWTQRLPSDGKILARPVLAGAASRATAVAVGDLR